MARKLRKKEGKETYSRRETIVEPVFGQAKEGRGLRRFLLRGLEKVNGERLLRPAKYKIIIELLQSQELEADAI
jgi:hypothetical protein